MTFSSNSEEIRYYIKQLLDQGEEKTTQEIIQYVKEASGKEFTGGMLAGALNEFIDRERAYRRVRRGVYAKGSPDDLEPDGDAFDAIIRNAIEAVEQARRIDIESLNAQRLQKMQEKSRRILAALQGLLED